MTIHRASLVLAALLLAGGAVQAAPQKVFRCGPDGRIYSQTPCKDGFEVNADDKRSVEQRKAAEETLKRDEKMVEKAARERQAKEAAAAKQGVSTAVIANPSAAKPAASAASGAAKRKPAAKKPAPAQT